MFNTKTIRQAGLKLTFALAFALSLSALSTPSFAFTRQGAAEVHRRCIPALRLGNSGRRPHHGVHDQAARQPEHRLQGGDGPRYGAVIEQGRREVVRSS